MLRLCDRLRDYHFRLRPPATQAGWRSDDELHTIQAFRMRVYSECSSVPRRAVSHSDWDTDIDAWHILALRNDRLHGCLRLNTFAPQRARSVPGQLLMNSRCGLNSSDRRRFLQAASAYLRLWKIAGGPFVQPGGLAIAAHTRGTALGPALCLAGVAFMRVIGSHIGLTFAAEKANTLRLYQRAGCFPLSRKRAPVDWLTDEYHADRVLVMGIDPKSTDPELEWDIRRLQDSLGESLREQRVSTSLPTICATSGDDHADDC